MYASAPALAVALEMDVSTDCWLLVLYCRHCMQALQALWEPSRYSYAVRGPGETFEQATAAAATTAAGRSNTAAQRSTMQDNGVATGPVPPDSNDISGCGGSDSESSDDNGEHCGGTAGTVHAGLAAFMLGAPAPPPGDAAPEQLQQQQHILEEEARDPEDADRQQQQQQHASKRARPPAAAVSPGVDDAELGAPPLARARLQPSVDTSTLLPAELQDETEDSSLRQQQQQQQQLLLPSGANSLTAFCMGSSSSMMPSRQDDGSSCRVQSDSAAAAAAVTARSSRAMVVPLQQPSLTSFGFSVMCTTAEDASPDDCLLHPAADIMRQDAALYAEDGDDDDDDDAPNPAKVAAGLHDSDYPDPDQRLLLPPPGPGSSGGSMEHAQCIQAAGQQHFRGAADAPSGDACLGGAGGPRSSSCQPAAPAGDLIQLPQLVIDQQQQQQQSEGHDEMMLCTADGDGAADAAAALLSHVADAAVPTIILDYPHERMLADVELHVARAAMQLSAETRTHQQHQAATGNAQGLRLAAASLQV
jgi:hypothetical protein